MRLLTPSFSQLSFFLIGGSCRGRQFRLVNLADVDIDERQGMVLPTGDSSDLKQTH